MNSAHKHSPFTEKGGSRLLDEAAERLRELHGPAINSLTVERVVIGVFFTGVQFSDASTGVAYTPPEFIQRASTRILGDSFRAYQGRPATEMISSTLDGAFAHVVRLASLNALSVPFFKQEYFGAGREGDFSKIPELIEGRRVCMVGAIIPLLKKFAQMAPTDIAIIDKKTETLAEATLGRFVPLNKTAEALAACETAVITGASIANGSIDELLSYLQPGTAVAIVGPTAGFIPEPLFRMGVTAVGTVVVTNEKRALQIIAEGSGGYQLFKDCVRKINLINRPALMEIMARRKNAK